MISKIQRSRRQFCDVTITDIFRRVQKQLHAGDCKARVSFRLPFTLNSPFASVLPRMGWVGVGALKMTLYQGAGNPSHRLLQNNQENLG